MTMYMYLYERTVLLNHGCFQNQWE